MSRRSLEGLNGDSPAHEDGLEVADRSAINSLESQLASKGAEKSASYRWRPFQQKRTGPQASDELPDSPAIAAGEVRQNRSSELARTLSRMSSRVLR